MRKNMRQILLGALAAIAVSLAMAGGASAGAGTTFCGYQQVDGSAQWVKSYVGRRQCPATSVSEGMEGVLVWSEYIA